MSAAARQGGNKTLLKDHRRGGFAPENKPSGEKTSFERGEAKNWKHRGHCGNVGEKGSGSGRTSEEGVLPLNKQLAS